MHGKAHAIDIGAPPPMPMQLRRQRTKDRERLCESLTPQYKSNFGGLQTDGQVSAFEGLKDTHFYRESGRKTDENIGFKTLKALNREIGKILQSNLEIAAQGAVFLRFDPDAPQYMRALIAGVDGTPYSSALFSFDIYCPPDYPNVPPLVTHTTKNASFIVAPHGPGGISPNIHSDTGKVCLSLLGTWSGPSWEPDKSNIYQVLSAILWMILGAQRPYYMEPGYGGWEGNILESEDEFEAMEVQSYEEDVKYYSATLGILAPLKDPMPEFEAVIIKHFLCKRHLILATLKAWVERGSVEFKNNVLQLIREIEIALTDRYTASEYDEDIAVATGSIDFLEKKMAFLTKKVGANQPDAESKVPLAVKRLKMGPALLEKQRETLKTLQEKRLNQIRLEKCNNYRKEPLNSNDNDSDGCRHSGSTSDDSDVGDDGS